MATTEQPEPRDGQAVVAPRDGTVHRGDVDGDDPPGRVAAPHLVHRDVVEHATVDQEVAVARHGREHARDGDARPDGRHDGPAVVVLGAGVGQVRRHAEVGDPQVDDVVVTDEPLELVGDAATPEHRRGRERVVEEPREGLDGRAAHALGGPAERRSDRHDRPDAGAPDHVDRGVELLEHLEDADVREPPRPAAAEDERGAGAREQPGEARPSARRRRSGRGGATRATAARATPSSRTGSTVSCGWSRARLILGWCWRVTSAHSSRSSEPGRGSSPASATSSTWSAQRSARRLHGVHVSSISSTRWRWRCSSSSIW